MGSEPNEARELQRGLAVSDAPSGPDALARSAAQHLANALSIAHEPSQRPLFRLLLDRAANCAQQAIPLGGEGAPQISIAARSTLLKACAAKARDALHGAGQLSLSAQRAPTLEACEEGWQRVEAIVAGGEATARRAAECLSQLEKQRPREAILRAARAAARDAETAARAARKLVDQRNHAYTFHTDGGFSFGEGWYLAAAGVLAGVAIQIEPSRPGTPQAEKFLRDAGLDAQIQPYRSRPRAMKHVTAIVGRAFRADPDSAQRRLRAAFLGDVPISSSVSSWVDRRLSDAPWSHRRRKVLLWIRDGMHHSGRNTDPAELLELTVLIRQTGLVPVLVGDALRDAGVPDGAIDMILFWKDACFRQLDMRRAQLHFFEYLRHRHGLLGQLGVTTAGMDGPALMGLPTLYLTAEPNVRMREWVGALPGYEEVVRDTGYLERIQYRLSEWASSA